MTGNSPIEKGRKIAEYLRAEKARTDALYADLDGIKSYLEAEIKPLVEGLGARFQAVEQKVDQVAGEMNEKMEDLRAETAAAAKEAEEAAEDARKANEAVTALGATMAALGETVSELGENYKALEAGFDELYKGVTGEASEEQPEA